MSAYEIIVTSTEEGAFEESGKIVQGPQCAARLGFDVQVYAPTGSIFQSGQSLDRLMQSVSRLVDLGRPHERAPAQ